MFEKLLREIRKLEQTQQISIPIEADKDGYFDKECPNNECLFEFKVDANDWSNIFKDEKVFCPLCRHEAPSDNWWTTEQLKNSHQQVTKHILGRLDKALEDGTKEFNRSQTKNSFIKMSVKLKGTNPRHFIVPLPSKEEMEMKIQCKECNAKYAVIGSAFFCPCCGHNSAEETFDNSLKKIEAKIKNIPIIRSAVESVSKDEAETTCRSLIETSLLECVVAFQRFCEVIFIRLSPQTKIKINGFQNLEIGSNYWKELFGQTYTDWLAEDEMKKLIQLFQKRHLLSHTEGIVDHKYIEISNDSTYSIGQRIVVKERDVIALLALIKTITNNLRQKL